MGGRFASRVQVNVRPCWSRKRGFRDRTGPTAGAAQSSASNICGDVAHARKQKAPELVAVTGSQAFDQRLSVFDGQRRLPDHVNFVVRRSFWCRVVTPVLQKKWAVLRLHYVKYTAVTCCRGPLLTATDPARRPEYRKRDRCTTLRGFLFNRPGNGALARRYSAAWPRMPSQAPYMSTNADPCGGLVGSVR